MSLDSGKPIANPSVVFRDDFDNWAVLFDPDTAKAFGLNPVGIFIWKRLDGKHSTEDIVRELRITHENVPPEVENHIIQLIDNMVKCGLVGYAVGTA